MLQVIRESQSTEGKAKEQPKDRLLIRAQVPRSIDLDAATGGGVSTNNLPSDYLVPLSTFSVGNAHVAATSSSGGAHRGGNNNNNNLLSTNGYVKVCLKVYLTHSGDKPATNVSIVLSCPSFLHAEPKNVVIQRIGGASATPVLVKFYLYATKACLPSGLDVQVMMMMMMMMMMMLTMMMMMMMMMMTTVYPPRYHAFHRPITIKHGH